MTEHTKIDANSAVDSVIQDVAKLSREKAILYAQVEALKKENDNLQNLVSAYEEKEKLENAE